MLKGKVGLLIVTIILSMTLAQTALASDEIIISPKYTYTDEALVSLVLNSGVATCYGQGRSIHTGNVIRIRLALQKRIIGGTKWGEVCYWTASANGLATARISKEKAVSSGNDYRLQLKCTISDAEGVILESVTKYSSIKRVN